MILEELYAAIKNKIKTLPDNSYVAKLYKQGNDRILQKLGEESVEVIIAATNKNKKRIIEEMADLYFMTLLVMAIKGISLNDIYKELERRTKKDSETASDTVKQACLRRQVQDDNLYNY